MRIIAILSLLLLASPVFGELTKEDLQTIMKEDLRTYHQRGNHRVRKTRDKRISISKSRQ